MDSHGVSHAAPTIFEELLQTPPRNGTYKKYTLW